MKTQPRFLENLRDFPLPGPLYWRPPSVAAMSLSTILRSGQADLRSLSIRVGRKVEGEVPEGRNSRSLARTHLAFDAAGGGMNGDAEIVGSLKIDPEFGCVAKVARQT